MNIKGIYRGTQLTTLKPVYFIKVDTGIIKNKKLEVFSSYEKNELVNKLYYLSDLKCNLLREKLVDKNRAKLLDIIV